jgi:hypothetical protein
LYDNRPSRNDETRPRSIFNINITQSWNTLCSFAEWEAFSQ